HARRERDVHVVDVPLPIEREPSRVDEEKHELPAERLRLSGVREDALDVELLHPLRGSKLDLAARGEAVRLRESLRDEDRLRIVEERERVLDDVRAAFGLERQELLVAEEIDPEDEDALPGLAVVAFEEARLLDSPRDVRDEVGVRAELVD